MAAVLNLLHCLLREFTSSAELIRQGDQLALPLRHRPGHFLRCAVLSDWPEVTITGPVSLDRQPMPPERLAQLLFAEIACRLGCSNDQVPQQWQESLNFIEHFATLQEKAGHQHLARGVAGFITAEQRLILGHRYHPAPKARSGLPFQDWLRYSPEARTSFPLSYLLVKAPLYRTGGVDLAPLVQQLAGLEPPAGYQLLPIHPVQLHLLEQEADFQAAVAREDLTVLGSRGHQVYPTTSIRTVYEPHTDSFLKFGLKLRITNWVRRNITQELEASVALSRHISEAVPQPWRSRILLEPGFIGLHAPESPLSDDLNVLYRTGLRAVTEEDEWIIPACTLFEEEVWPNSSYLREILLESCLEERALIFFKNYLEDLFRMSFGLFEHHGLLVEPHLQNVVVCVNADLQVRCLIRDMDSVRFIEGFQDSADQLYETCSPTQAQKKLFYTLIVNNSLEAAKAILRLSPSLGPGLQAIYAEVLDTLAEAGFALAKILQSSPTLPAKANLITRWKGLRDSQAEFIELPNPLYSGRAPARKRPVAGGNGVV